MRRVLALAMFSLAAMLPAQSRAESRSADTALQKQVFGRPLADGKGYACFRRAYTGAHLRGHPQQNVSTMLMLISGENAGYSAGIGVTFRQTRKRFEAYGSCSGAAGGAGAGALSCGIDCDGGSIDVRLRDPRTLMVSIPDGARVSEAGKEVEEEAADDGRGLFGQDDKLFRLERTRLSDCLPLVADPADKAALRRGD